MKFLINLSKSGMDYSYEKRIGQSRRRGGYNDCPDHEELSFPVLASRVTRRLLRFFTNISYIYRNCLRTDFIAE